MVKDLTATGRCRCNAGATLAVWARLAGACLPLPGSRFSPAGSVRALSELTVFPTTSFTHSTHQWPVGFLCVCRWFNKKCPKQVLFDPSEHVRRYRIPPGPVDVSAKIRHGASTTCLRLNLSPHYLADQCFYFERSHGPGSRRGFAQGQS